MNNKIIIPLMGGLGNQLFQISYAIKAYGKSDVIFNTALTEANYLTNLLKWSVHRYKYPISSYLEEIGCKVTNKLGSELIRMAAMYGAKRIGINNNFDKIISKQQASKLKVVLGYYQDLQHQSIDDVKKIAISYKNFLDGIISTSHDNSEVVVHIRRGDMPQAERLSFEYYDKIINENDDKSIKIVTNDIVEVKRRYTNVKNLTLCKNDYPEYDFLEMANSKIFYLSNSTFSYWASISHLRLETYAPSELSKGKNWMHPMQEGILLRQAIFE